MDDHLVYMQYTKQKVASSTCPTRTYVVYVGGELTPSPAPSPSPSPAPSPAPLPGRLLHPDPSVQGAAEM